MAAVTTEDVAIEGTEVSPPTDPEQDLLEEGEEGPQKSQSWWSQQNEITMFKLALVVAIVIWVILQTLFYHYVSDLTPSQAFYYGVQAGLNCGFTVFRFDDTPTIIFTTINLIIGAAWITAALAIFMEGLDEKNNLLRDQMMKDFTKGDKDGDGQLDCEEFTDMLSDNPMWGLSRKDAEALFQEADDDGTGTISAQEFQEFMKDIGRRHPLMRAKHFYLENKSLIIVLSAFVFWYASGMIFAHVNEGYDFVASIYFTTSAMATTGFVGPSTDAFSMWFFGFYLLTGIPVFIVTVGKLAAVIVDRFQAAKLKEQVAQEMHAADIELEEMVTHRGQNMDHIDLHTFMCVKLAKLGKVNTELIDFLETEFKALDADGSGTISWAEIEGDHEKKP